METFTNGRAGWLRVAALGLLMSGASCGSDASDRANTSMRSASHEQDQPSASQASNARASLPGAEGRASIARATPRSTENPPPPRPSTKEACDACQGIWAVHGIDTDETCICKTNDEGKECVDGTDCQGECLLEGDAEFHIMEQGNPPRGYFKGQCAGYDTTFGCFRHIPDDIQAELPLTADEAGEAICVD